MPKSLFTNQEIIIGVSGSIAAYKAAEIVSFLSQRQAKVTVVMTQAATHLIRPLTFQTLSHNRVYTELFSPENSFNPWPFQAGPKQQLPGRLEQTKNSNTRAGTGRPEHIALADKADIVLVAPATANIIGKIAHGIADDLLTTVVMATRAPVLVAPAMNEKMYHNPIVQENIACLKKHHYRLIEPEKGHLACQKSGVGRMARLEKIIKVVESVLSRINATATDKL